MTLAQEAYAPVDVVPGTREELHCMLQFRRPHDGLGEGSFLSAFLYPHDLSMFTGEDDEPLAYLLTVPNPDGTPSTTLFSCHVDTVHHDDNMQKVQYDPGMELFYKDDGEPLGADDGAGVWLMLCMYRAGVPGSYVFHRGEEKGGTGSRGMARHHTEWLKRHTHAIAFDRRGETSVITHQRMGSKGCSNNFAEALAARLNLDGTLRFKPDDSGLFTDTANYFDLISECTNVSCGYAHEHSEHETLDWNFLSALRDVVIKPEIWAGLPSLREPGDTERKWGGGVTWYSGLHSDDGTWAGALAGRSFGAASRNDVVDLIDDLRDVDWATLRQYVATASVYETTNLISRLFDELNWMEQELDEMTTPKEEDEWPTNRTLR